MRGSTSRYLVGPNNEGFYDEVITSRYLVEANNEWFYVEVITRVVTWLGPTMSGSSWQRISPATIWRVATSCRPTSGWRVTRNGAQSPKQCESIFQHSGR
jgi:hypothetical protein